MRSGSLSIDSSPRAQGKFDLLMLELLNAVAHANLLWALTPHRCRAAGCQASPAMRSAPTPSRALRGDAAGELNHQLVGPAGDQPRRGDRRPRRREPFAAMPHASRVASWSTWRQINPGEATGAHAVASPSRRCRRRAEASGMEAQRDVTPQVARCEARVPGPVRRGDARSFCRRRRVAGEPLKPSHVDPGFKSN